MWYVLVRFAICVCRFYSSDSVLFGCLFLKYNLFLPHKLSLTDAIVFLPARGIPGTRTQIVTAKGCRVIYILREFLNVQWNLAHTAIMAFCLHHQSIHFGDKLSSGKQLANHRIGSMGCFEVGVADLCPRSQHNLMFQLGALHCMALGQLSFWPA